MARLQSELNKLNTLQETLGKSESVLGKVKARTPLANPENTGGFSNGPSHPYLNSQQMSGAYRPESSDTLRNNDPAIQEAVQAHQLELAPGQKLQAQATATPTPASTVPTPKPF